MNSDADGIKEKYDRDPLRDLYIEISPIYGYHGNMWFWEPSPYLEITASFKTAGVDYSFITPAVRANTALQHIFI